MNSFKWLTVVGVLLAGLALQTEAGAETASQARPRVQAPGQAQQQVQPGVAYGRGRGGLPWAWNDRNRDGICDPTGRPVGEGRPIGFGRGRVGRGGGADNWESGAYFRGGAVDAEPGAGAISAARVRRGRPFNGLPPVLRAGGFRPK
jgi:hypothetical protein